MKVLRMAGRVLITVLVTALGLLLACIIAIFLFERGPSEAAKVLFVRSVNETSRMGFLGTMFLPQEEVDEIMKATSMPDVDKGEFTNTELINIDENAAVWHDPIETEEISGSGYKGVLMTVYDASKVFVGTVPTFGTGKGQTVAEMIDTYNAAGYHIVAGVNGGDFIDEGVNASDTSQPLGAVFSENELVFAEYGDDFEYHLAGFTEDNKLVMGYMTIDKAKELKIRDALYCVHTTGPFLVMNGEMLLNEVPDGATYGGGKNPRTAIGQRADGAVLLLCVDGRQANSLGATFQDLARIMHDAGAVNACAVDGGTSTQMLYEGQILNHPYSPFGPRKCPTAWLVRE